MAKMGRPVERDLSWAAHYIVDFVLTAEQHTDCISDAQVLARMKGHAENLSHARKLLGEAKEQLVVLPSQEGERKPANYFLERYKNWRAISQDRIFQRGAEAKNPAWWIYMSKVVHGLTEKQQIEHSGSAQPLQINLVPSAEPEENE